MLPGPRMDARSRHRLAQRPLVRTRARIAYASSMANARLLPSSALDLAVSPSTLRRMVDETSVIGQSTVRRPAS